MNSDHELERTQEKTNEEMARLIRTVPPHSFYIALPQLISRVGHNNEDTVEIVKGILKRVLVKFPRHALWHLGWLRHSANEVRSDCGDEIFRGAQRNLKRHENKRLHDLLLASKSLFKYLIDLAKYSPKNPHSRHFNVRPWTGDVPMQEFVPPVQAALSLARSSTDASRDSFPSFVPRMRGFSSQVIVMASKARPKKLTAFAIPAGQRHQKLDFPGKSGNHPQPCDVGEMHFLVKFKRKVSDSTHFKTKLRSGEDTTANLLNSKREFMNGILTVLCGKIMCQSE